MIVFGTLSAFPALPQDTAKPSIEKLDANMAVADPGGEWLWYDAQKLDVEGRGWVDTEAFYDRLPAKAKGVVRDPVWSLSKHSAGMAVRFVTNAPKLAARWKLVSENLAMPHMPATGVSGLDLYVNDNGTWRWIGNGRPTGQTTQAVLASGIPEGEHEYMVYLPLYNGTESLEIGIPPTAALSKAPVRPADHANPIVFYGTSITQGGCASRPGMAHPAILGRRLGHPVINLGFSGNGTMDPEMGALLAELDAAVYVIDCAPNMPPDLIMQRTEPFITALRAVRPDTPIVLVENIAYQAGAFLPGPRAGYVDKNKVLHEAYDRLAAKEIAKLSYVPCESLLGNDGEATVDGTHPTDLGFQRIADALEPVLWKALR
jgi:lysophospholipase L1-like esterase